MEPRRGGRRRRKTETPVPVNPEEERFEEGWLTGSGQVRALQ